MLTGIKVTLWGKLQRPVGRNRPHETQVRRRSCGAQAARGKGEVRASTQSCKHYRPHQVVGHDRTSHRSAHHETEQHIDEEEQDNYEQDDYESRRQAEIVANDRQQTKQQQQQQQQQLKQQQQQLKQQQQQQLKQQQQATEAQRQAELKMVTDKIRTKAAELLRVQEMMLGSPRHGGERREYKKQADLLDGEIAALHQQQLRMEAAATARANNKGKAGKRPARLDELIQNETDSLRGNSDWEDWLSLSPVSSPVSSPTGSQRRPPNLSALGVVADTNSREMSIQEEAAAEEAAAAKKAAALKRTGDRAAAAAAKKAKEAAAAKKVKEAAAAKKAKEAAAAKKARAAATAKVKTKEAAARKLRGATAKTIEEAAKEAEEQAAAKEAAAKKAEDQAEDQAAAKKAAAKEADDQAGAKKAAAKEAAPEATKEAAPDDEDIRMLLADPSLAAQFDGMYGDGRSGKFLRAQKEQTDTPRKPKEKAVVKNARASSPSTERGSGWRGAQASEYQQNSASDLYTATTEEQAAKKASKEEAAREAEAWVEQRVVLEKVVELEGRMGSLTGNRQQREADLAELAQLQAAGMESTAADAVITAVVEEPPAGAATPDDLFDWM